MPDRPRRQSPLPLTRSAPADPSASVLGTAALGLLHDLLGVLAVSETRLALVLGAPGLRADAAQEVGAALAGLRDAAEMAKDVLRVGRPGTRANPADLAEVLQDSIAECMVGGGSLSIRVRAAELLPVPMVRGPVSFVRRAVDNLIRNATKHARSRVELDLERAERDGRPGYRVIIDDDGPGVQPEERERIFTAGVGTTAGGYGLGLASTRWVVEALDGAVELRPGASPALGGARFELWLPAASAAATRLVRESVGPDLSGLSVALVEDDPQARRVVDRWLRRLGASVQVVEMAALNEPEWWLALREPPVDAILLDLNLGNWEGAEVWSEISRYAPAIAERVVFVSGAALGPAGDEVRRRTGRTVLQKPLDLHELARAIAEVSVRGREGERGS